MYDHDRHDRQTELERQSWCMTMRERERQSWCMTMRERQRERDPADTDRRLWPKEELTDLDLAAGGSVSSVWRTFPTH